MEKLIRQLRTMGCVGMKKRIRQLRVIGSSGAEWLSGAAAACLKVFRAGSFRRRAGSLLMTISMIAGLLSPMGPFVQEALAAAAQP